MNNQTLLTEINQIIWLGTTLIGIIALSTIWFIVKYTNAQQNFLKKELEHKRNQLNLEQKIKDDIGEKYRRELHDGIGTTLALLKMQLKAYATYHTNEHNEILNKSILLAENLIVDVKQLSTSLRQDSLLNLNLKKSLQQLTMSFNETNALYIETEISENINELSAETCFHIYRICQELINNTIQHAGAKSAKMSLIVSDNYLDLTYIDNGSGLPKEKYKIVGGEGLNSIEERVKLLQGKYTFKSDIPGISGFFFKTSIPFNV